MALAPLGVLWGTIPRIHLHTTLLGNLRWSGPCFGLVRVWIATNYLNLSLFLKSDPETFTSSHLTIVTLYPLRSYLAT